MRSSELNGVGLRLHGAGECFCDMLGGITSCLVNMYFIVVVIMVIWNACDLRFAP